MHFCISALVARDRTFIVPSALNFEYLIEK